MIPRDRARASLLASPGRRVAAVVLVRAAVVVGIVTERNDNPLQRVEQHRGRIIPEARAVGDVAGNEEHGVRGGDGGGRTAGRAALIGDGDGHTTGPFGLVLMRRVNDRDAVQGAI